MNTCSLGQQRTGNPFRSTLINLHLSLSLPQLPLNVNPQLPPMGNVNRKGQNYRLRLLVTVPLLAA